METVEKILKIIETKYNTEIDLISIARGIYL